MCEINSLFREVKFKKLANIHAKYVLLTDEKIEGPWKENKKNEKNETEIATRNAARC